MESEMWDFSKKSKSVRLFVCMLFLLANSGSTCWDCGIPHPNVFVLLFHCRRQQSAQWDKPQFPVFFYFLSTSRAKYTTPFLFFHSCVHVCAGGGRRERMRIADVCAHLQEVKSDAQCLSLLPDSLHLRFWDEVSHWTCTSTIHQE